VRGEVVVKLAQRTVRVALAGTLGIESRGKVEAALPDAAAYDGIIIDCLDVEAIDSAILRAFIKYRERFVNAGHDPANLVFLANTRLRRLMDLSGFSAFVTVIGGRAPVTS
jgi:anti-anti-sigma regulatory factor